MFLTVFVSILFCVIVLLLSNEVFASVYWFVVEFFERTAFGQEILHWILWLIQIWIWNSFSFT